MKIIILGGNGYLGWPTAVKFATMGHQVVIVDSGYKDMAFRKVDRKALFAKQNLSVRCALVRKELGLNIEFCEFDICDFSKISELVSDVNPDSIIHYAEQPSAPYSMLSYETSSETLHNNLFSTLNVLYAMKEFAPECHLIKLGTMGEYGTPNIDIEEGWIDIHHNGRTQTTLFPRQASSLYHTTKVLDTDLIWFYVRNYDLRVTDLMQGPVYGFSIPEFEGKEQLYTHFAYDDVFGTVVNRFIAQAVCKVPLTIYGSGDQTRGYLNVIDTLRCIQLAAENPPSRGKLNIFNQFTETLSVNQIADRIIIAADKLGIRATRNNIVNPRKEMENHYYNPKNSGLLNLGLEPTLMTEDVLETMISKIIDYRDEINIEHIMPKVKW